MALPKLLRRLFGNEGFGPYINPDILPPDNSAPYLLKDDPIIGEARMPAPHAATHMPTGIDAPTAFAGVVAERSQSLGEVSGTVSIDLSKGMCAEMTVAGPIVVVMDKSRMIGLTGAERQSWTVVLSVTNGSHHTITWPAEVKWPRGTAPVMTTHDVISLFTPDNGGTWFGTTIGSAFTTA